MKEVKAKYTKQEKLMHRRQVMNLTRAELAEKSGVSVNTITDYEFGRRRVNIDTISKIAQALGCTIDEIVIAQ